MTLLCLVAGCGARPDPSTAVDMASASAPPMDSDELAWRQGQRQRVADDERRRRERPGVLAALSARLPDPTALTVFALTPTLATKRGSPTLRGYPIRATSVVTDGEARRTLFAALREGISDDPESALCFYPRHGLRATIDGESIEMLICFQCSRIEVHRGTETERYSTSAVAQPLLDRLLGAQRSR